jgi:hypothetical protein
LTQPPTPSARWPRPSASCARRSSCPICARRPSARISSRSTPRRRRFPRPRAPNARIEAWLDEQTRAVEAKARPEAKQRLFGELIKDAGATLLQRLVYLRLLETNGLRTVPIVAGGWDSRGYKDFREVAPRETRKARTASAPSSGRWLDPAGTICRGSGQFRDV